MKTLSLSILIAILLLSSLQTNSAMAQLFLDGRNVTKSQYYTGQTGQANLSYISLNNWLKIRAQDEQVKDIYNRGFIIDDPHVVKPLYDIANRLLKNWPGTAPKFPIFVRADTSASIYGAEALITNEMLIFYGSLMHVESDDELAALVAHELSHILLGHNAKAKYVGVALQLFDDYESMKNLHNVVKAGHIIKTGDKKYKMEFDTGLEQDLVKANEQKKRAAEIYYAYHGSFLGKPAEIKADLLAADLLIKAGYSPMGLRDTLSRLGSSYNYEKFISDTLADSSKQILDTAKIAMAQQVGDFQSQLREGEVDFGNIEKSFSFSQFTTDLKGKIKGSAVDFAWKNFKTSHPVPDKRISKLANYLDNNYGLMERQKNKTTRNLKAYQRSGLASLKSYKKLELASLAIIKGDLNHAASQSLSSLIGANDADPYKRYTAHSIRRDQSKIQSAITNIDKIKNYRAVPSNALLEMIDLLVENNRYTKATSIINAKEYYGYKVPEFYPNKIEIALAQKKPDKAKLAALECIEDSKAGEQIQNRCLGYGLLAGSKAVAKKGGILGGLKAAGSAFTGILNPAEQSGK